MSSYTPIFVIAGPTASGKSSHALDLAKDLKQEDGKGNVAIINADSMQVYNGLPILSAQPSPQDHHIAAHYLYGYLPAETSYYSVGKWLDDAKDVIDRTIEYGGIPIVVGGTGLYIKALMYGLNQIPDVPDEIRISVAEKLEEIGRKEFYKELLSYDPQAKKLHKNDTQRILRSMEVYQATGKPLSYWQEQPAIPNYPTEQFQPFRILPERKALYQQCNDRFDKMMEQNVLEEVANLKAQNLPQDASILNTLGFKELSDHLDGKLKLDAAIELAKRNTRRFAKRQMTWFKNQ